MFDPLDDLDAAIDKVAASEATVDVARLTMLVERLEFQRLRAVRVDGSQRGVAGRRVDDGRVAATSLPDDARCRLPRRCVGASSRVAARNLGSVRGRCDLAAARGRARRHVHARARSGDRRGRAATGCGRCARATCVSSDRWSRTSATRSTVMAAQRRPVRSTNAGDCTCRSCSTDGRDRRLVGSRGGRDPRDRVARRDGSTAPGRRADDGTTARRCPGDVV